MLNKFFAIGRLCKENELKTLSNGTFVLENDLAFDSPTKDENGKFSSNFIRVTFYGKGAENVAKFTDKGSLIQIEGHLRQKIYVTSDGKKVSYYCCVVNSYSFIDGKKDLRQVKKENAYHEPTMEELNAIPVADEDLPF